MNPTPSISIPKLSLRDYFAIFATEKDIQHWKYQINLVETIVPIGPLGETKRISYGLPKNWREQARYLFADHMLEARSPD